MPCIVLFVAWKVGEIMQSKNQRGTMERVLEEVSAVSLKLRFSGVATVLDLHRGGWEGAP